MNSFNKLFNIISVSIDAEYLLLHADPTMNAKEVDRYIIKWFVLSTLTSRYITSPESVMDYDLRTIKAKGFPVFFEEVESAQLSDTFWEIGLVQRLETSAINSPFFNVFIASQIFNAEDAMFTKGTRVEDLIKILGDVHHIFPKKFLIRNGWNDKLQYNQIANYTYLDTQVNKDISDDNPQEYFSKAFKYCEEGNSAYGNIKSKEELIKNLNDNCIPLDIVNMNHENYLEFLQLRRKLMAEKIHKYYKNL